MVKFTTVARNAAFCARTPSHTTRQLFHRQWLSGPCCAKRPANASLVHQCCAAATDALAAGCHPISSNRPDQGRCYSAATYLEEWKQVLIAQEIAQGHVPGVQVRCLVEIWKNRVWQEHIPIIAAVDLHPRIDKYEVRETKLWYADGHYNRLTKRWYGAQLVANSNFNFPQVVRQHTLSVVGLFTIYSAFPWSKNIENRLGSDKVISIS